MPSVESNLKLNEVNFSLVKGCNAYCIFCPQAGRNTYEFMPIELVERIVDEISSLKNTPNIILKSHVGENGESTLHPQFIPILRILNKAGHDIDLFTNFSALSEEKSRAILDEGLLSSIHFNVDGLTSESYRAIKALSLPHLLENVFVFLDLRKEKKCKLCVHIITAENYSKAVFSFFGKPFTRTDFIPNEAEEIKVRWEKLLDPCDVVGISSSLMWNEKVIAKKAGNFKCFNLERIKTCAFIAPNGDWYACCFDNENRLVLGNLYEQSLMEIANGEKRKKLVSQLEAGKFDEIGFPCNRVDCCQVI